MHFVTHKTVKINYFSLQINSKLFRNGFRSRDSYSAFCFVFCKPSNVNLELVSPETFKLYVSLTRLGKWQVTLWDSNFKQKFRSGSRFKPQSLISGAALRLSLAIGIFFLIHFFCHQGPSPTPVTQLTQSRV